MSAIVQGYWPGNTAEQRELQPGFANDCAAWGEFMAGRYERPGVVALHEALGVGALLSCTTDGMADADVDWVAPGELAAAAGRLRELVVARDPRVEPIVAVYQTVEVSHPGQLQPRGVRSKAPHGCAK